MNPTHLRRSLVAVATAIACLVAMATPAAATLHDADITGGVITLTKTGLAPEDIDLDPATTSCTTPSTLQLDETGTTAIVTDLDLSHVRHFGLTSNSYLWTLTRSPFGNLAGALDSTTTPHTITSMRVALLITIYDTTGCTPTGTPICTIGILLHLGGTSTSTSSGDTVSLTGTSVGNAIAFPTCVSGPSIFVGTASTVTSPITGTLTT